jgi:hypothetical protein
MRTLLNVDWLRRGTQRILLMECKKDDDCLFLLKSSHTWYFCISYWSFRLKSLFFKIFSFPKLIITNIRSISHYFRTAMGRHETWFIQNHNSKLRGWLFKICTFDKSQIKENSLDIKKIKSAMVRTWNNRSQRTYNNSVNMCLTDSSVGLIRYIRSFFIISLFG